ncbi:MAG: hypothetical protein SOI26_05215 [Coriobacteriales bacterium]|jgi:tetratricopeptide (TPR) repeat protein
MVMIPRAEDFERLAIRWADAPHTSDGYPNIVASISAFPELYAQDRDSLPQNDSDRAFALVCRACDILDDRVMFAQTDEDADRLTKTACGYLGEAVKLDPQCFDAVRILYSMEHGTRDVMVSFLRERAEEVCGACETIAAAQNLPAPEGRMSVSVYMRPYLRWLFNLANEELNCGRYRRSLEVCEQIMDLDAPDLAGARLVAAYDFVKLEDPEGLAELIARFDGKRNAWFDLSRVFMAYKQFRLEDAASILHEVVRTYPGAGNTLSAQQEVLPGAFCHLCYQEGSADELFVAVSEAAVILDECGDDEESALSAWIADDPFVQQAREAEDAERDLVATGALRRRDPRRGGGLENGTAANDDPFGGKGSPDAGKGAPGEPSDGSPDGHAPGAGGETGGAGTQGGPADAGRGGAGGGSDDAGGSDEA